MLGRTQHEDTVGDVRFVYFNIFFLTLLAVPSSYLS